MGARDGIMMCVMWAGAKWGGIKFPARKARVWRAELEWAGGESAEREIHADTEKLPGQQGGACAD